jgi:hypothetical protein
MTNGKAILNHKTTRTKCFEENKSGFGLVIKRAIRYNSSSSSGVWRGETFRCRMPQNSKKEARPRYTKNLGIADLRMMMYCQRAFQRLTIEERKAASWGVMFGVVFNGVNWVVVLVQ